MSEWHRDAVHHAINAYVAEAGKVSLSDILGLPDWVPRWSRVISDKSLREMKTIADDVISAFYAGLTLLGVKYFLTIL